MQWTPHHELLEQVERDEREARLRLAEARKEAKAGSPRLKARPGRHPASAGCPGVRRVCERG
jgi:hypothetical protein